MEGLLVKVTPFLVLLVLTTAETYYITPSSSIPCPGEGVPCYTLSQYATKSSNYFAFNTTLILLPGNHSLDLQLSIRNITFVFIETTHSDISITCRQSARFTFETINVVSMRGLVLFGCVNNEVTKVEQFTLEDCTFQGQERNGTGLELNEVSTAYIMRSSFSSNTGKEISQERRRVGGAIIIVNSTLGITISNCTVNNNTVTGDDGAGGAVFADSSPITIVNSTLNNNTVTGAGGAVYAIYSPITIVNSTLNNNTATVNGGAVSAGSSLITIVNSTLNNNTLTADYGVGGAVYAYSSPITIVNTTLNNNTVTGDDGAGGAVFAVYSPITIVNSTLNNNTATVNGGAVSAGSSLITIVNSTLNNNTLTADYGVGGAVYAYSSPITIVNTTLNNNTVTGDGGAVCAHSSNITIVNSTLNKNTATVKGGAVYADSSSITIINSTLNNNTVTGDYGVGGAVYALSSNITIINSTLNNNTVTGDFVTGGAVYAYSSPITIIVNSILNNNTVTGDVGFGGAVYAHSIYITIVNTTLNNNTVTGDGGAVFAHSSNRVTIVNSTLNSNTATESSGAVSADLINITIVNSTLNNNTVTGDGGVGGAVFATSSNITIVNSTLNNNTVTGDDGIGGAVFAVSSNITIVNSTLNSNMAGTGVLYAVESTLNLSDNTTVSNNYGSLFIYSCNVTFMGYTNIMNNHYRTNTSQEGGAVTSFQSEIVFMGTANLMYNTATRGGAISATQSKLYMYGDITVSHNTASVSGGGIHAYQSELNFKENVNIRRNNANDRGGGIHVISSTTSLSDGCNTYIGENHAKRGGGMYLESSAKVYLLKSEEDPCECDNVPDVFMLNTSCTTLLINNNTADYGGAVYVDDDTNSGTCNVTPFSDKTSISSECFIQGLSLYVICYFCECITTINTYFTANSASVAGDVLYGGLLDRCGASPFAEIFLKYRNSTPSSLSATSYMVNITDLDIQDFNSTEMISSDPVRVCFCRDNQSDCSYHPQPESVRKGETFTVSLVAVDHINNTIANSTIHAFVSLEAKLGEGQSLQLTSGDGSCTDLTYSILSPHNSEKLYLYADGPCMRLGISTANLTVNITPCPIGFNDSGLSCECDPILYPEYISNCSIDRETVQRKENVWFAYVKTTDHRGYILHKHCPFDYCHPPTKNISVNLNIDNGANELCAFNRSDKLCGSCEDSLSLSLGSSRCMPCSNNWLALLIGFAIAGVALVAFLLKLNFTVAVGTFHGLIFYANIFAANRAIFFPHDETKLLTVFIAWLNLDYGFETCFYDGMDGYVKTWLQLAFPLYVISLVVAIIIISDYSTKFAALFTGKNPIATLATLILLSYTKLLRTIIASLSFTELQYSDDSHEVVWLVDANIPYLSGKHIPLFITALVIVIIGITYTFILFSWQWLVYCPNRGPLRWIIGNTKVIAFMDAYHNPYNKDHRYWIGLLLLLRFLLYLVFALNVSEDPRINLLSVALAIVILFAVQIVTERKCKIHNNELNNIFDVVSLLNLAGLTVATFFITEDIDSQNMVAYISTGIAFVTFLAILVYHVYQFVLTELFHNIATKLHMLRGAQNKILVETASPSFSVEEPVSETECDALPEDMDTISVTEEKQFVTAEEAVDIEPVEVHTGPNPHSNSSGSSHLLENDNQPPIMTGNRLSHVKVESPNFDSHAKPINVRAHHLIHRKTSRSSLTSGNPPSHIPAPCNEKTRVEIELPNLASGHELSTVHVDLFQPSARDEASPEDDYESENESTPLLPQDH